METDFNRRDVIGWLILEMETFCMLTGTAERKLCEEALGNPDFLKQLRSGSRPRIDSMQRALNYMDERSG